MNLKKYSDKLGTINSMGEEIEIYEDYLLWKLEELFVKAGKMHWPEKVEQGKPSPGFSVNLNTWQILNTTDRDFIVKNQSQDKYYKVDKEKANREVKDIVQDDTNLKLIPIYCCEVVEHE